jgi:putative dehydrogenase
MRTATPKPRTNKPASPIQRVGMLGVGIMGRAMAANLVKAGFAVSGYDPDPKAMKRLKAAGGTPCASAGDMAAGVDVIICALPSPESLHGAAQQIAEHGHRKLLVVDPSALDITD